MVLERVGLRLRRSPLVGIIRSAAATQANAVFGLAWLATGSASVRSTDDEAGESERRRGAKSASRKRVDDATAGTAALPVSVRAEVAAASVVRLAARPVAPLLAGLPAGSIVDKRLRSRWQ